MGPGPGRGQVSEESVRPARDALLAKRGLIAELVRPAPSRPRRPRIARPGLGSVEARGEGASAPGPAGGRGAGGSRPTLEIHSVAGWGGRPGPGRGGGADAMAWSARAQKELLQFYVREHRLETPAQAQELARALRAVMAKYLDPAERLLLGLSPMDGAGTGGGGPGPGSKPANASSVSAANSKAGGRPGSASPTPGPGPAAAQRKTLAPSGSRASIAR
eukprot:tig00000803_g4323.t1